MALVLDWWQLRRAGFKRYGRSIHYLWCPRRSRYNYVGKPKPEIYCDGCYAEFGRHVATKSDPTVPVWQRFPIRIWGNTFEGSESVPTWL